MEISQKQQDALVSLARGRGNRPRDFRDAVHEMVHVIEFGVDDNWERENIHAFILTTAPHERMMGECNARATERLACERAGVGYDTDRHIPVAMLEAAKDGLMMPKELWTVAIERAYKDGTAEHLLEKVLALVEEEEAAA